MQIGDIYSTSRAQYKVVAVYIGALGYEDLVELESLTLRSQEGRSIFVPYRFLTETLIKESENG